MEEGCMMDENLCDGKKLEMWSYTMDEILGENVENGWKNGSFFC
jgi:hypothetical protein